MRVYILDGTTLVGVPGESFETLEWKRKYQASSSFSMDINRRRLYATEIRLGRFLYLPDEDDLAFKVEQVETIDEPGRDKDLMRVSGRAVEGVVTEERICYPPTGESHDTQSNVPGETAIKHYVRQNAGTGAIAARRIPSLSIADDQSRGSNVYVQARYQQVASILKNIGLKTGLGWEVTFKNGEWVFEVVQGVDRSNSVFLDISFDTLEKYSELASLLDSKTHVVVAGQGEGENREIVERSTGTPEGFERREAFVDARDIEEGETEVLEQRGDAVLESLVGEKRYEATVHQFGSFRYREHWNLGDIVLLRDVDRDLATPVRIVEVISRIHRSLATPERQVALDRPYPTLKDRVEQAAGAGAGLQGAVDYHREDHAGRHLAGGGDGLLGHRFVRATSVLLSNQSTTSSISATLVQDTGLPGNATHALVELRSRTTAGTHNVTNAVTLRDYDPDVEAVRVHSAPASTSINMVQGFVAVGGDRQFRYAVNVGGGTVSFDVVRRGYLVPLGVA